MVELLVASTILTVGIVASLVVYSTASNLRRTAAETRTASAVLGNLFETMRPLTTAEVAADYADGAAIPVDEPILRGLAVSVDQNGFVVGDTSLEMTLTATWTTFNGGQRTISFDTVF